MKKTIYILYLLISLSSYAQENRISENTTLTFIKDNINSHCTFVFSGKRTITVTETTGETATFDITHLKDIKSEGDIVTISYLKNITDKEPKKIRLHAKSVDLSYRIANAINNLKLLFDDWQKESEAQASGDLFARPAADAKKTAKEEGEKKEDDSGKTDLSKKMEDSKKKIKDLEDKIKGEKPKE